MNNETTPKVTTAARVRQLLDDMVALAKPRTGESTPKLRGIVSLRARLREKAIALSAELFESYPDKKVGWTGEEYPDSDGLGYLSVRDSEVVGFLDQVNGHGAKGCADYTPTTFELRCLAKYWIERILDLDFYWYQTQCTGSSEWREREFAERRLNRLTRVLGQKLVDQLEAEVSDELRDRFGAESWDAFAVQRTENAPA